MTLIKYKYGAISFVIPYRPSLVLLQYFLLELYLIFITSFYPNPWQNEIILLCFLARNHLILKVLWKDMARNGIISLYLFFSCFSGCISFVIFFFLTLSSVLQNSIFSFFNTTYLLCLFSYSISLSYLLALLLMTKSLNQDQSALLSFWPIYTIANWTHPFKCSWSTLATKYTKVKSSPHPQVSPPYSCHPETGWPSIPFV